MKEQIESLKKQIEEYLQSPISDEVAHQLNCHKNDINRILDELSQSTFTAAFIGKIGVGKTSAICKAASLQYGEANNGVVDILKTGAGRTTVCEVRIEYAPEVSIKIETLPHDEVKQFVRNFADFVWNKSNKNISDEEEGGNLLSEELTRCIRNMLGLTIEKKKQEDGKWKSFDKAIEFSKDCESIDQVNDLMYECLALDTRTETELYPNPSESKNWQAWLKDNFAKINDGKNKYVSIPSQITIYGPFPLERNGYKWNVIDTKGIDSFIHREDIRKILDTEEIFPIICSSFVDAPDADCRAIYDLGVKLNLGGRVERDVILLILDKDESDKVADIDEDVTDSKDKKSLGRSIREEQVVTSISHAYKIHPNVLIFDSKNDSESDIWQALEDRKNAYFNDKSYVLKRLVSASQELLSTEFEKVSAFQGDIAALKSEWRKSADSKSPNWDNLGEDIKDEFNKSHHRTLAASIDRKGDFYNLNVYEAINQYARSKAVLFCKNEIDELKARLSSLREKHSEFANQISSQEHDFANQFNDFASQVGQVSKEYWIKQVQTCFSIWTEMMNEWGRGAGYKERVIQHWTNWLTSEGSRNIHESLLREIACAWGRVLADKQD